MSTQTASASSLQASPCPITPSQRQLVGLYCALVDFDAEFNFSAAADLLSTLLQDPATGRTAEEVRTVNQTAALLAKLGRRLGMLHESGNEVIQWQALEHEWMTKRLMNHQRPEMKVCSACKHTLPADYFEEGETRCYLCDV